MGKASAGKASVEAVSVEKAFDELIIKIEDKREEFFNEFEG